MPQTENKELQQTIQFKKIEILNSSFDIFSANNSSTFAFDINVQNEVDYTSKGINVIVKVEAKTEESKNIIASVIVGCIFGILNFDEVIKADAAGKFQIPRSLNESLNAISVATTRGIMFASFKGTFMHNAILPIIDLENFPKGPAVE